MYLQKLEIQGFKSFAQKTTFLFPDPTVDSRGITAVIGPNGSGKSNIADAIRWVLGEQSMKLLRSKKAEDVIFFGSDKKAQQGFCEVSLFFDNEDHAFPLEYAEVVMTRRLYRSGESEYLINKAKVRLADLALLIAQASIGQRSYSVIGQGMIDSIINTPPSERKEFFLDAAGVRPYQIKKDTALSKLRATRENLSQARMLMMELEPKMRFFQRQAKRLEEREGVEQELQTLLRLYYNTVWNELSGELSHMREKREVVGHELEERSATYERLSGEFREQEARADRQDTSRMSELQRERAGHASEKQRLVSHLVVIDGRLQLEFEKIGETQLAFLQSRITELRTRVEQASQEQTALEQEQNHCRSQLLELEKESASHEHELAQHMQKLAVVQPGTRAITPELIVLELRAIEALAGEEHEGSLAWFKRRITEIVRRITTLITTLEETRARDAGDDEEKGRSLTAVREALEDLRSRQHTLRVQIGIKDHTIATLGEDRKRFIEERVRAEKDITLHSTGSVEEKRTTLLTQRETSAAQLEITEHALEAIEKEMSQFYGQEQESHKQLLTLQKTMASLQREMDGVKDRLARLDQESARKEAHQEDLLGKIIEELHLSPDARAELTKNIESVTSLLGFSEVGDSCDRVAAREDIDRLKRKLENIGTIDPDIVREYESTKERYEFLSQQITDLATAIETLEKAIQELDIIMRQQFDTSLLKINASFEKFFKKLFDGGSAHLTVQKKEIEHEEETHGVADAAYEDQIAGVEIEATPPGKKFKSISFLSGGEKALTAVALLCAILSTNPSPFVVLDEIDAALDESNANRLAEILQTLATRTQFIVVTHNRVTMHIGTVLYGITMGEDGISKALSLDIRQMSGTLAAQ